MVEILSKAVKCLDDRQQHETSFHHSSLVVCVCVHVCVCVCVLPLRSPQSRGPHDLCTLCCSKWGKGSPALLRQWTVLKHWPGNREWWGGVRQTGKKNYSWGLILRPDLWSLAQSWYQRHMLTSFVPHNLAKMICSPSFYWGGSHQTGCGSTPWNMWSFVAFIWTCCFWEDTWAPLKRRHGLLSIRKAVGCFRFDEQEVHMHSTKNVNETHSSQFLMETSLDLGIRRWREMGSPPLVPLPSKKKPKKLTTSSREWLFWGKRKEKCVGWEGIERL